MLLRIILLRRTPYIVFLPLGNDMSCLYILCPGTKIDHPHPGPLVKTGEREFFAYSLGFAKLSGWALGGAVRWN